MVTDQPDVVEEDERDDEVFPLPENPEKTRTMKRHPVSVKDLSKSYEKQIEMTIVEVEKRKKFEQRRNQEKVIFILMTSYG